MTDFFTTQDYGTHIDEFINGIQLTGLLTDGDVQLVADDGVEELFT